MITVDSPERAPDASLALEEAAQDASKEGASLEDEAPTEGPPNVDQAVREALAEETTTGPPLQAR